MEFDPLSDYTREQGARILYETVDRSILRRILTKTESEELGENVCIGFYSWLIKNLIFEKEITERRGRFSGGNLAIAAQHLTNHVSVSEIVRGYEDHKKARKLCDRDNLRQFTVKYCGYLWVPLGRRDEFERELDRQYHKRKL